MGMKSLFCPTFALTFVYPLSKTHRMGEGWGFVMGPSALGLVWKNVFGWAWEENNHL